MFGSLALLPAGHEGGPRSAHGTSAVESRQVESTQVEVTQVAATQVESTQVESTQWQGEAFPADSRPARFLVRMEGLPVGAFTGCEGLPSGADFSYGLAGTVRLTREVQPDSPILATWIAAQDRPARAVATITGYDSAGRPVGAWRLRDAWPVRYMGPRFGSPLRLELLELAHCGVLRALP